MLVIYSFLFCLKKLKIYNFKKKKYPFEKIDNITDETSNLICPICQDNIMEDIVKFKVCSHILHKKCSKKFLLHYINKCPICRKNIYSTT